MCQAVEAAKKANNPKTWQEASCLKDPIGVTKKDDEKYSDYRSTWIV